MTHLTRVTHVPALNYVICCDYNCINDLPNKITVCHGHNFNLKVEYALLITEKNKILITGALTTPVG